MPVPQGTVGEALTDSARDGLAGLLEQAAFKGLEDAYRIATELPQFIADNDFIAPGAIPTRLIGRAACRAYARGGGPQRNPGFDGFWGGLCAPYLDSIGESPDPGGVGLPFTGGQCPGVRYEFDFSFTDVNGERQTVDRRVNGRLVGAFVTPPNQNGALEVGVKFISNLSGSEEFLQVSAVNQGQNAAPAISNVRVDGGGADTCGDPPPVYDPPKIKPGLPTVGPQPIDFPGIGPTPFTVTFSPEGTLVIDLPEVGVDVAIEDPFGFGGGGDDDGGGGGGGAPPGDVGAPGAAQDTGPGGDAEGEAPEGSVLTGVRVQILSFPSSRNKYTDEVFRGAYYVYMGVPGLLDLDFGGAMVRTDQFFFAEKENLTAWRVRANTNYELRATPYYRSAE